MSSIVEAQIIESEERLRQAMLHSDVSVLDKLVAPELLFTSHVGQLVTKADDLAFHQARILRLTELEPSQQQIQIHPDFAVVSVLMHLVGTYESTPIDQHIRYTRVWSLLPNGSVQVIAGHMSEIPPTKR
ncbi:MAG: nuclear transport factor 2 family protein [Chloroflexota bacterium]